MIDFSNVKAITIPEGAVKKIASASVILWEKISYKNWLTYSVNQDGTDYRGDNGEDGYRKNYRYSASSKTEKSAPGFDCIGYIPVLAGDIVRITNVDEISQSTDANGYSAAYYFTQDFTQRGGAAYIKYNYQNGIYMLEVPVNYADIRWMKLTLKGVSDNTIITVNEEI